jgi:chromosome partitioning protein
MALTIAVSSLKGGVGKSTIALNLATCLHRAGHRALVIDTDPQGTCRTWAAKAADSEQDGPPVVAMDSKSLRRDLERVSHGFGVAVIDCPPRMGAETRAAMLASDLVVMPVIPGAADVWALQETIAVLEEARQFRDELRAVIVLNRADRTTLAKLAMQALEDLDVRVLDATLRNRVAYGEATLAGLGVVDYAPDSDAAFEVRRFAKAVLAAVRKAA